MSPLVWQGAAVATAVPAGALTAGHLGRTLTTPPGVRTLPPLTGTLSAVRCYLSGSGKPLVSLEVTDVDGVTRTRTVEGATVVTLTTPGVILAA